MWNFSNEDGYEHSGHTRDTFDLNLVLCALNFLAIEIFIYTGGTVVFYTVLGGPLRLHSYRKQAKHFSVLERGSSKGNKDIQEK